MTVELVLHRIGVVRSSVTDRKNAPRQGYEGAPEASIEVDAEFVRGLDGIKAGDDVVLLTWLHQGQRDVLEVRPRKDPRNPLTGVFATRSPDRPNPIGLHRVRVLAVDGNRVQVANLEAIDGTPILDVKPVLGDISDR